MAQTKAGERLLRTTTKLHWTQRPGGKAKLARALKRGVAKRTSNEKTGDGPVSGKQLAKSELNELARIGAEIELKKLEKRVERLRIFLGFRDLVEAGRDVRTSTLTGRNYDVETP